MYGRYCTDLDECTELENPCPPFSTCFNWYGGHSCNCIDGYEKTPSGFCEVVNTCKSKVTDKQCRFDCTGPYECICPFGYNSIHHRCTDINECFHNSDNCEPVQTCLNLYGSFKCVDDPVCPAGFSLVPSYRDFVNFFKAGSRRGRSSRRTRSVYTHICTKDAVKREKVLQGEYRKVEILFSAWVLFAFFSVRSSFAWIFDNFDFPVPILPTTTTKTTARSILF